MTIENEKILAKQRLEEFLKTKKLRKTGERFQILDCIYSQSSFFTLLELYDKMNKDYFHVSLSTIYYTIELLLQCNLVIRHTFDLQNVRYEKTPLGSNHYYRICMQCGTTKAFTDLKLKKSISLRDYHAFTPQYHSLYIYGICKKCGQKNAEVKK
ncbi:MAG: transcriptional repressor [Prevotellaceae bacterium]|jgi:Fur family ferric uptake transcriptional regulator|nr:transcriptional repressor [Prevotellaceae bacterium]